MIGVPEYLPEDQKKFLQNLIEKSRSDEQALFAVNVVITSIKVVEHFYQGKGQEVLKGAHIVADNPELYKKLTENSSIRDRISSHYRGQKLEEKGVNLKTHADFLVGLNQDDKAWMQLEGHKVSFNEGIIKGAILLVLHMIDYLKYKWTGKNVGPCGLSQYTESNSIKIPLKAGDAIDGLGDISLEDFFNPELQKNATNEQPLVAKDQSREDDNPLVTKLDQNKKRSFRDKYQRQAERTKTVTGITPGGN